MNIFEEIQNRQIDYRQIIDSCQMNFAPIDFDIDISIIVPVCGRTEFNKVLCDHFRRAVIRNDSSQYSIVTLTIVEHSDTPQHRNLCDHWVNHVWIPKNGKPFNKCLAHNVGALLTKNANCFLFHDVDILVPEDFFNKLLKNFPSHDALQTFTKRRLMHCDQWITGEIISNHLSVKHIPSHPAHFKAAQPGAMGGSIFLTNELFFKTTFCPQIFHDYGLEDAFFWQCINLLGKVGGCDQPTQELYHLYHEATRITKEVDWNFYNAFLALTTEEKKRLIKLISDNLNHYRNEDQI